ncbi:PREDICTED: homeobox protein Hox-C4 isoform X3 [Chinchilla lanigera]|uniref:homeobox protein Hox-C4 isoform X3 n=1 Tax=Chinchilla lanigera TaxID=34839 RepID=UPI00038EE997|nr:PREDICTED: homeobox protein Hox-C4 isoform X3 [Chinchilla lanigera]
MRDQLIGIGSMTWPPLLREGDWENSPSVPPSFPTPPHQGLPVNGLQREGRDSKALQTPKASLPPQLVTSPLLFGRQPGAGPWEYVFTCKHTCYMDTESGLKQAAVPRQAFLSAGSTRCEDGERRTPKVLPGQHHKALTQDRELSSLPEFPTSQSGRSLSETSRPGSMENGNRSQHGGSTPRPPEMTSESFASCCLYLPGPAGTLPCLPHGQRVGGALPSDLCRLKQDRHEWRPLGKLWSQGHPGPLESEEETLGGG